MRSSMSPESIISISAFRPLSEHCRAKVEDYAHALQQLSNEFKISNGNFAAVSILAPELLGKAILSSVRNSKIQSMSPDEYQHVIESALVRSPAFEEPINPFIRQEDNITKLSIFGANGLFNVTLDLPDKVLYDDRRRGNSKIEELTETKIRLKPGRVWLGSVSSIKLKHSGFKADAEDILNSRTMGLDRIELGTGIVIKNRQINRSAISISSKELERRYDNKYRF